MDHIKVQLYGPTVVDNVAMFSSLPDILHGCKMGHGNGSFGRDLVLVGCLAEFLGMEFFVPEKGNTWSVPWSVP
jgi:hypothetical protein